MLHSMKFFTCLTQENVFRYYYSAFKYGCSYSKDITKVVLPASTISPDYLLQNLRDATSSQNVLDLVGTHYKIMNNKQLLQGLRTLFTLQKYGNSSLSTKEIIKHPDFEKLCFALKSQAGMIELNETLEALKIITFVGVSSNSTIVKVLLQLLRHNINDLTLSQLMFLDFLLRQFKSSPLVDGLLIAIPVVFEANLFLKMDKENIGHLAEYLHYASKKNVSPKCIQLIVNNLIKAIDFSGELDSKVANSILWSITDMEPREFLLPLFKRAINTLITEGFDKLDYQDVTTTLSKISAITSFKSLLYYDDIFYDSFADYVIDKDLGFEEAIYTLLKFSRVNHTNDNLLNYVSKKCKENPELLTKGSPLVVFGAAIALAQSEYKPTYWQIMKEVIQTTKCFEGYEKRDIVWLKLAASLCALDIYKFDVLEQALKISNLRTVATSGISVDYENFLIILQAINVFNPDNKYLLPEKGIIQAILAKIKPILEYPLEGALQKALGGDAYVNTCMKTTLYHHIDHVIIMRKGGFPVPLKKNCQLVEDLDVPADGFLVLILALQNWHYTNNSKRLKATTLLMIKTLEGKGYNVVPVCVDVWKQLPDFERIPFIMQAIKLKIEIRVEMSNALC